MAFSIYYLIRSHPNNFFNILPFLIFFIMNIKVNDINLLKFKKRFLNFFFLIVFSTSLIPIFNNYEKFKTVFFDNNIPIFKGIKSGSCFYFNHSFALKKTSKDEYFNLALTKHNINFVSAFQKKKIFATQFHPEKSKAQGVKLISNFLET